ncbi:MAG: SMI1/KNR4 family protein [Ktedonobacteraceae bacterium]
MQQSVESNLSDEDYQRIEANQLGIPLSVFKLKSSDIRFYSRISLLFSITGIVILVGVIFIGLIKNLQFSVLFAPLLGGLYALFQGGLLYRFKVRRARSERVIVCVQGLLQIRRMIWNDHVEVVRWQDIQTAFASREYSISHREGKTLTLTDSYQDLDELVALTLWHRIETWMSIHAPYARQTLLPGASDSEILQAETAMDITLPEDFKASCRIHNGGYTLDLVTEMEMLPLEGIVSMWQLHKELEETETWSDRTPYYFTEGVKLGWETGPLQPVWWHLHWIPCGHDRGGNLCCIDLAPAPGGSEGQIIDWDHEVGPSRVLASSFLELLSTFANDLEAGEYVGTSRGLAHRSQI